MLVMGRGLCGDDHRYHQNQAQMSQVQMPITAFAGLIQAHKDLRAALEAAALEPAKEEGESG